MVVMHYKAFGMGVLSKFIVAFNYHHLGQAPYSGSGQSMGVTYLVMTSRPNTFL
jgi:hypothetical protein